MFEETQNGTLQEIFDYFKPQSIKGEIVICVAGKPDA
jgi:16S rRNA (cytidine1402-2'-O)-methyltransferase